MSDQCANPACRNRLSNYPFSGKLSGVESLYCTARCFALLRREQAWTQRSIAFVWHQVSRSSDEAQEGKAAALTVAASLSAILITALATVT